MAKRIMVIDGDAATRELFDFFLTDEGWEIFTYDYARASLEVVRKLSPDLIILDLNVVQAGAGWSFLQLLKMEEATAAIPVVICTTAVDLTLEIEGYLATRHISIVRKPFDIETFILTIQKFFIPDLALPILVVEDNEALAATVTTILGFSGYLSVTAANGLLALEAVAQAQYALILLDMSMPVMNGLEFLMAYAQQAGPHSPVIVFSGLADLVPERLPEFVMDTLPKPVEVSHLVTLVNKYAKPVLGTVGL